MSTITTHAPVHPADLIGQPVILMGQDGTYQYEGRDRNGFETIVYRAGKDLRGVETSFDRVAPADTPLADAKDPRIHVEKASTREARAAGHYGSSGNWKLRMPDGRVLYVATKRDAVATGRRRLAILDWHTANTQDSAE